MSIPRASQESIEINKGEIVLYKNRFEVQLKDNSVWLTKLESPTCLEQNGLP